MEYKLAPVEINLDKGEELVFPSIKERTIEKRGHVITFTVEQVEKHIEELNKIRKEVIAKQNHDKAVMENIESYHPFVKEMKPEDLFTAWMYKGSKDMVENMEAKLQEIDNQIKEYNEELADIYEQIPELKEVEVTEE